MSERLSLEELLKAREEEAIKQLGLRVDAAHRLGLPGDSLKHIEGKTEKEVNASAEELKRRIDEGEPIGSGEREALEIRRRQGEEMIRQIFGGGR